MERPVDYPEILEAIENHKKSYLTQRADLRNALASGEGFPAQVRTSFEDEDDLALLGALIAEGRSLQREFAAAMAGIAKENEARRQRRAQRSPEGAARESS